MDVYMMLVKLLNGINSANKILTLLLNKILNLQFHEVFRLDWINNGYFPKNQDNTQR